MDNVVTVKPSTTISKIIDTVCTVEDLVWRKKVTRVEPRGIKYCIIVAHVNIIARNSVR